MLRLSGGGQSDRDLIRDSAAYWNEGTRAGIDVGDYSHWLGAGPWKDRDRWLRLGRVHFHMYERLALATGTARPLRRIVEWGSGGGANAIHFMPEVDEFWGVEIAQASLDECARVLSDAGFRGFHPVLIPPDSPERALDLTGGDFDFFLSTYVFELLPGKRYGARVLRTAHDLLRPGGLAIIQIRYDDGSERSTQKTVDYYRDATRFTSYRVEEFWLLAERAGFRPEYVTLVPRQTEEFSGDLYAYFAMVKPDAPAGSATPA
jgi:SAM-dependent methyltransferase